MIEESVLLLQQTRYLDKAVDQSLQQLPSTVLMLTMVLPLFAIFLVVHARLLQETSVWKMEKQAIFLLTTKSKSLAIQATLLLNRN